MRALIIPVEDIQPSKKKRRRIRSRKDEIQTRTPELRSEKCRIAWVIPTYVWHNIGPKYRLIGVLCELEKFSCSKASSFTILFALGDDEDDDEKKNKRSNAEQKS
jgi:hypothetical protein